MASKKQHWWVTLSRILSAFFVVLYAGQLVYKHFCPAAVFEPVPITLVYFSFVILSGEIMAGFLVGVKTIQAGNIQVELDERQEDEHNKKDESK